VDYNPLKERFVLKMSTPNVKEICLIFDRKEKLWKLRIQRTMKLGKQLDIDILANDVGGWRYASLAL
jgi:hypothetical protein